GGIALWWAADGGTVVAESGAGELLAPAGDAADQRAQPDAFGLPSTGDHHRDSVCEASISVAPGYLRRGGVRPEQRALLVELCWRAWSSPRQYVRHYRDHGPCDCLPIKSRSDERGAGQSDRAALARSPGVCARWPGAAGAGGSGRGTVR